MLNGGHFVEALRRLNYPAASSLKASDFDWLFNGTPESNQFLRFFCRTLNHNNVLTVEEVRDFQELKKSGKPLLDEAALNEALKTIGKPDGSGANASGSGSLPSFLEEDVDVDELEAELKALRKEKALKQQRYNRLHVAAISRADVDLRLATELESSEDRLKDTGASVAAANASGNASLQELTDAVGNLASYVSTQPEKEGKDNGANPSASKRPLGLLSELSLDPYLNKEMLNTKALSAFAQKYYSQAGKKEEDNKLEESWVKMDRLQRAHIMAQHQLMLAAAQEKGLEAGLRWLSKHPSDTKVRQTLREQCRSLAVGRFPQPLLSNLTRGIQHRPP